MLTQYNKKDPLMNILKSTFKQLPAPQSLTFMWNFGSLLFLCLVVQIISGVLLASSYSANLNSSFFMVNYMMENYEYGWLIRYFHANGASFFFICLYLHMGRGLYYMSYRMIHTWMLGVSILILTMATAFMGYVLPINQMSFWGVSVITNLFSEVPYIGPQLVKTIWGGSSVGDLTIVRFFTFHFMIPFIILGFSIFHISYLHVSGSSNSLGVYSNSKKLIFYPFFSSKDLFGFFFFLMLFFVLCFYNPLLMNDNENFVIADPAVTPIHIQPEWYFLFAYAILRSIPNKLGGVIALMMSIMVLYLLPFMVKVLEKSVVVKPIQNFLFWVFIICVILLSWVGMRPVEAPYIYMSQILTFFYFVYFMLNSLIFMYFNKKLFMN